MRKFILLWTIIIIAGLYGWYIANTNSKIVSQADNLLSAPSPTITQQPDQTNAQTSLFVPYWGLSEPNIPNTYNSYLYFGVEATRNGINTSEDGYIDIPKFLSSVPANSNKVLVVRMIDSTENSAILGSQTAQNAIISQATNIASQKGFSGIVLDLEMSAIPFDSLIQQINEFNDSFSRSAKSNNLSYGITMYGDTFYRPRPFDLQHLASDVDTIYIMSYDLHKANGNPGPNFPITTNTTGEYDLSQMLTDYEAVVPKNKMTIVFGLFGYDWPVDAKGNAAGNGTAISYEDIEQKFIMTCAEKSCALTFDPTSGENREDYTDMNNQKHVIWFDGPKSVQTKEAFLKTKGIEDFSFWAWSYF